MKLVQPGWSRTKHASETCWSGMKDGSHPPWWSQAAKTAKQHSGARLLEGWGLRMARSPAQNHHRNEPYGMCQVSSPSKAEWLVLVSLKCCSRRALAREEVVAKRVHRALRDVPSRRICYQPVQILAVAGHGRGGSICTPAALSKRYGCQSQAQQAQLQMHRLRARSGCLIGMENLPGSLMISVYKLLLCSLRLEKTLPITSVISTDGDEAVSALVKRIPLVSTLACP